MKSSARHTKGNRFSVKKKQADKFRKIAKQQKDRKEK